MAETNGNGNGGPWWTRFAERFGIPAVFALVLLYFLVGHVDAEIHEIRDSVREQRFYLRAICLNLAESDTARAHCDPRNGR